MWKTLIAIGISCNQPVCGDIRDEGNYFTLDKCLQVSSQKMKEYREEYPHKNIVGFCVPVSIGINGLLPRGRH